MSGEIDIKIAKQMFVYIFRSDKIFSGYVRELLKLKVSRCYL